jgi:glycosyltransferase involved in cell wall biosynthesis
VISVLLPYRDAEGTIAQALASVLGDLDPGDEVIAIDDGSRDGSAAPVAQAAARDARVRMVQAGGRGVAAALADGLTAARGELIGRMDADDVSLAGRFAAARELLTSNRSLAAVGVQVDVFGAESETMRRYVAWQNALVDAEDHARAIYVESPLCHPSTLLCRAALEAVGGFRDAPWPEDWDLWMRLHRAGFGLAKVPRVFFRWRRTPSSVTARDPRCAAARLLEARAHYLAAELGMRDRAFAVWGAGRAGRRLARALVTHGRRPSFFADIDPHKVGRKAFGIPILCAAAAMARARADGAAFVVAVAAPGARDIVRARLVAAGFHERVDFVCAS